jgi:hypothetical protein
MARGKRGTDSNIDDMKDTAKLLSSGAPTKLFMATDDVNVQNRLANEMMDWADLDDSFVLDSFPVMKRMSPIKFYKMAEKNTYFAECLSYAKSRIGERYHRGLAGFEKYMDKQLSKLDALWIEAEEKKQAAQAQSGPSKIDLHFDNWGEKK